MYFSGSYTKDWLDREIGLSKYTKDEFVTVFYLHFTQERLFFLLKLWFCSKCNYINTVINVYTIGCTCKSHGYV